MAFVAVFFLLSILLPSLQPEISVVRSLRN